MDPAEGGDATSTEPRIVCNGIFTPFRDPFPLLLSHSFLSRSFALVSTSASRLRTFPTDYRFLFPSPRLSPRNRHYLLSRVSRFSSSQRRNNFQFRYRVIVRFSRARFSSEFFTVPEWRREKEKRASMTRPCISCIFAVRYSRRK